MTDQPSPPSLGSHGFRRRLTLKVLLGGGAAWVAGHVLWAGEAMAAFANGARRRRFVRPAEAKAPAAGALAASPPPFTDAEVATFSALVESIIPTDTTPGARETGSAQFALANIQGYGVAAVTGVKQALAAIDQISIAHFGQPFAALAAPARDAMVGIFATDPGFAEFWEVARRLTVFHFYAQPAGYLPIGLPGPNVTRGGYPDADDGRERGCVTL